MSAQATTQPQPLSNSRLLTRHVVLIPALLVCVGLLIACVLWSITLGAADITPDVVYQALFAFDAENFDHLIIQTVRLPRVLAGVIVGASLAVAGAIMQGLTRNPLADSGILGINAGAALAVVIAVYIIGNPPLSLYAWFAFGGASAAAVFVYLLGLSRRGEISPLRLTLAGVIVSAFVTAFTTAILIFDQETLERIRFWTAGSLGGREMDLVVQTAPYMLVGLVAALLISRQITTLSLGDEIATGLGQNTARMRMASAVIVVLLSGGAVALAGPIGFVGLIVPHVVRFFTGVDYRWIIPFSALLGAILVTVGDVGARVVIRPQELPVGVVMALVGAPFFIALARWKVVR
jgi:iron complex transport system permease protein